MSDSERKKLLGELEAEFRRTGTRLAIAQGEFEQAYAAMWQYTNEHSEDPQHVLAFSPDITIH